MSDIFDKIWHEVHGHSESVDPLLVQSWVRDTWREVGEARTWSWLRKRGVMTVPTPYSTGTVTCTPGSQLITFAGGAVLDNSMVGRQFRLGDPAGGGYAGAIYDILYVDPGAGTALIWPLYNDTETQVTAQAYKIFQCYLTPDDSSFFSFLAVTNPPIRKRLRLHVNNETIDYHDSPRNMSALGPACLSGKDWSQSYAGKVYQPVRCTSIGPGAPSSGGTYAGQTDSLFIVTITGTGQVGVATFDWSKDSGSSVSATTSIVGSPLQDGVTLYWPSGVNFTQGDIFVVRCTPAPQYGMPRYEIYPHPTTFGSYPYTYSTRVPEIDSEGFVLPYTMRPDVIKAGALAKMARYAGTDSRPNPFAQIARAQFWEEKFQDMLGQLVTSDDYIMETNVSDPSDQWEYMLLPWMNVSGTGLRPTAEYDPTDMFLRY